MANQLWSTGGGKQKWYYLTSTRRLTIASAALPRPPSWIWGVLLLREGRRGGERDRKRKREREKRWESQPHNKNSGYSFALNPPQGLCPWTPLGNCPLTSKKRDSDWCIPCKDNTKSMSNSVSSLPEKLLEMIVTNGFLIALKCTKFVFDHGSLQRSPRPSSWFKGA